MFHLEMQALKRLKRRKIRYIVGNAFRSVEINPYRIFCGDFNVLEPSHYPHYSFFQAWEYKFYEILNTFNLKDVYRYFILLIMNTVGFGHTGDGYRYDHMFMSDDLSKTAINCLFLHTTRSLN